jgi:hypothetical protein
MLASRKSASPSSYNERLDILSPQGKAVTDALLDGESFVLQIHDEDLDRMVAELNDIGAKFSVEHNLPL